MAPKQSKSKNPKARKRKPRKPRPYAERFTFDEDEVFLTEGGPALGVFMITPDRIKGRLMVQTEFGNMYFIYNFQRLQAELTKYLKHAMNALFVEPSKLEAENDAIKLGVRYPNPALQEILDLYSEYAYKIFMEKFPYRMESLPFTLTEQTIFAVMAEMEKNGVFVSPNKSANRKLWDALGRDYAKQLKKEWLDLKPGPTAATSKRERSEILKFYRSILPICQSAKTIFKQNRDDIWREMVKDRFPSLDDEAIESLVTSQPSEIAYLITGRRFKKIIGKHLQGEAELKRQLNIARKEESPHNR